jgi:predicted nucleotide-binding protein (sugar kinase/HSP70/actin superfamily)
MKIGIPRAGYYFRFGKLWKKFFENLGYEVIVSPKTNREIYELGMENAGSEFCQPIKVLTGHVLWLKEKVDYIFVPDFLGGEKTFCCGYFRGCSDLMRSLSASEKILTMELNMNKVSKEEFLKVAKILGKNGEKAFDKIDWKEEDRLEEVLNSKKKKIAIVGEPYVLNDDFCNNGVIKLLEENGYEVVKSDIVPFSKIKKNTKDYIIHWTEEKESFGSLIEFFNEDRIDGVVYICPFNCGPDFLVGEIILDKYKGVKPILRLNVDETLSETRTAIRVEAFLDIL